MNTPKNYPKKFLPPQMFTVLCGDAVASQSGRVLPLPEVGKWCRERGVVFVVDATQSLLHWFDWNLGNPKEDGAAKGVRWAIQQN